MWRPLRWLCSLAILTMVTGCGSGGGPASKADLVVAPEELGSAFGLGEKFGDKVVETSGVIRFVNFDSKSTSIVALSTGPGITDIVGCCVMEPNVWGRLAPGQEVTLHGKKASVNFLVDFGWSVVKFGPNPCPIFTAQQVSSEFIKNPIQAHARFKDRSCYITGKVTKVEPGLTIALEGIDNQTIQMSAPETIQDLTGTISVGNSITALCTYSEYGTPDATAESIKFEGLPIKGTFPVAGVTYAKDFPTIEEMQAKVTAEMRAAKVEHQFEMADLLEEIKKPDFGKNWRQKIVEVTGEIEGFRLGDHPQINFKGLSDYNTFGCDVVEQTPWETYQPGQRVTIRGQFPEIMILPGLEKAIVMKAEPIKEPAKEITAADLVKQTFAAGDSFDTDWKGKYFKVSGALASADISEFGSTVQLDAGDEQFVSFLLASGPHAMSIKFADKPPGTKVRLMGNIDQISDKTLYLRNAWILSEKP